MLLEGSNKTLTTKTTSYSLPLFSVTWKVFSGIEHDLPPTAKVINYTIDGVFHSNLSLYNLSYYNDIGNYTCTASNAYGVSSVFVYIDIRKSTYVITVYGDTLVSTFVFYLDHVECNDSGNINRPPQDIITVSGEYIQFRCLVQGNLHSLNLSLESYWQMNFTSSQGNHSTFISDNSTDPYRIAVYPTCENCCNFTSQLTILRTPEFSSNTNISLTCIERLTVMGKNPVIHQSTSILSK